MANSKPNRVAVLLNDAFADWETGFFTAEVRNFFGAEVNYYSPEGQEVVSEGGLRVVPSGRFDDVDTGSINALIVCGSAAWFSSNPRDISETLRSAERNGVVIGVICAATLAAARSGLFDNRRHTSNGADWLKKHVPSYAGAALYQDMNDAISDGGVVSAPGTAPVAFARALLPLVYPGNADVDGARAALAQTR